MTTISTSFERASIPFFTESCLRFPPRNDLGDLSVSVFFNDLFQAVIHIFLADHEEDGVDQRAGLKFIKGMSKDGFSGQKVELFLLPFHEALALPGGDDYCIGLHHPTT